MAAQTQARAEEPTRGALGGARAARGRQRREADGWLLQRNPRELCGATDVSAVLMVLQVRGRGRARAGTKCTQLRTLNT